MPSYHDVYPSFESGAFVLPGELHPGAMQPAAFTSARQAVGPKGSTCPCCGQHVQVYRRNIYKRMAKCILWLCSVYQGEWVNLKDGPNFRGGDNAKLAYWKLVIPHEDAESLYKPTKIAMEFVANRFAIPKYCYVYDGSVLGFGEERVYLADCLERDFDLNEIGIPAT